MDWQIMFNFLLGALFAIVGALYTNLATRINKIEEKQHLLDVLVAGKYPTKDEVNVVNKEILDKLDEIKKDINACMLQHPRRKDDG